VYGPAMTEWQTESHVAHYRTLTIPHKDEGVAVLLDVVPTSLRRVLYLGTGDGRLLAMVLDVHAQADGVGVGFSPPMLALAEERFEGNPRVTIMGHDLAKPLPPLGTFDTVISGFAIHHLEDPRKRELFDEVVACLAPGGVFANLEHVASPTSRLQREFYDALGIEAGDPSNRLVGVETQLGWMREAGLEDVDCLWKWREMALLTGHAPG
jgi:tRNA (cmo5U34)-methyltransferase